MRLAVDTNRYRDFCEGLKDSVDVIRSADEIYIPFAVAAELRAGFACGGQGKKNENTFIRFLDSPRVNLLFPDGDTTLHYANLYRQLRAQGTPIPTNDIWIAALAVQHSLFLYTRDAHFKNLPQLPLV